MCRHHVRRSEYRIGRNEWVSDARTARLDRENPRVAQPVRMLGFGGRRSLAWGLLV